MSLEDAAAHAEKTLAEGRSSVRVPQYPVHALGQLADACQAIATEGQVDPAVVGQTLLGTAALLVQRGYRVPSAPTGTKPTSLFLFTQALSGDGKSVAEGIALAPFHEFEHGQALLLEDGTIQAVSQVLEDSELRSLGLFTSEAGTFFGGSSMDEGNAILTVARYNSIYDAARLSYARATNRQQVRIEGCFLSMSLLVQPSATKGLLSNSALAETGFFPRVLLATPDPLEPRRALDCDPAKHPSVMAFHARCRELLSKLQNGSQEQLLLEIDPAGKRALDSAFEHFEFEGRRGELMPIRAFAIRAPELIRRVAGVLAAFSGRTVINEIDIVGARALVEYSLACWMQVVSEAPERSTYTGALEMARYLAKKGGECTEQQLANSGPPATRHKKDRKPAIALLMTLGIIHRDGDRLKLCRTR